MSKLVDSPTVRHWLHDGAEIALFDVREAGQFGAAHLFYGISLPYSRLELDISRLAPRRTVRLVLCDDDQRIALRAAERLLALGYTNVHVLAGGIRQWQEGGLPVFAGTNVPAKAFGELVQQTCHTPAVDAPTLAAMLQRGDDVMVLDGRPLNEYRKLTIPGAVCCPNGELGYRVHEIVRNPATTIVVSGDGRSGGIIGAQTLINLGLPNPVMALENGIRGWYLAELEPEHGSSRRYPEQLSEAAKGAARKGSRQIAKDFGIREVDALTLSGWQAANQQSVFLCDVRTPAEFAADSLAGAQSAPGGQLVQATDQYVGVRHARIVLFDNDGIRAPLVASWLQQSGHQVWVLRGGLQCGLPLRKAGKVKALTTVLPLTSVDELAAGLAERRLRVLDVRNSMAYRRAHIPDTVWGIRPHLPDLAAFADGCDVVLAGDDDGVVALVAQEWRAGNPDAAAITLSQLIGGFDAWTAAQLPTASTPALPADADCIDFLYFVHDRLDGDNDAARQYLQWEAGLPAQLDPQERAAFHLPPMA